MYGCVSGRLLWLWLGLVGGGFARVPVASCAEAPNIKIGSSTEISGIIYNML